MNRTPIMGLAAALALAAGSAAAQQVDETQQLNEVRIDEAQRAQQPDQMQQSNESQQPEQAQQTGEPEQAGEAQRLSETQVRGALQAQGYSDLENVRFDGGMWEAEVTRQSGSRANVRIDAATGQAYPRDDSTILNDADIRASLEAAGFTRIHGVRFGDGLWQAEAHDEGGLRHDLYLDPRTGAVVGSERDD